MVVNVEELEQTLKTVSSKCDLVLAEKLVLEGEVEKLKKEVAELSSQLTDEALGRIEDEAVESFKVSDEYKDLMLEGAYPYFNRGIMHCIRVLTARKVCELSPSAFVELFAMGTSDPELIVVHGLVPFDDEEISLIKAKCPDLELPPSDVDLSLVLSQKQAELAVVRDGSAAKADIYEIVDVEGAVKVGAGNVGAEEFEAGGHDETVAQSCVDVLGGEGVSSGNVSLVEVEMSNV